jgi:hypothetical protein
MPVDLDYVERNAKLNIDSQPEIVLALVAELRLAREVVEAGNAWWAAKEGADGAQLMQFGMALAAYDHRAYQRRVGG